MDPFVAFKPLRMGIPPKLHLHMICWVAFWGAGIKSPSKKRRFGSSHCCHDSGETTGDLPSESVKASGSESGLFGRRKKHRNQLSMLPYLGFFWLLFGVFFSGRE